MEFEIENSENVVSYFGYWPKFCDAKLTLFSFECSVVEISIKLGVYYVDHDKGISANVIIIFDGVFDISLDNFLSENVIDSLDIEKSTSCGNKESLSISLESCFGLCGSFSCDKAKVIECVCL